MNFSFKFFNTDGIKNKEVTKVVPLEIEINRHKEQLEAAIIDLNKIDMFLGHNQLVKHNPEVNWKNGTIWFTRCLGSCKIETSRYQVQNQKDTDNGKQRTEQQQNQQRT